MLVSFLRAAILGLALCACGGAVAGELADFNAAVEAVSVHNRAALDHLRVGDDDEATAELAKLRAAWDQLNRRFAGKRPDVFDGDRLYVIKMTDIATRLVAADLMLTTGRQDQARVALRAVRKDFHDLRRSAGIEVLADCVHEAKSAMKALMVFAEGDPDWSKSVTRFGIASKAAIYGYVLDRCDGMADAAVHQVPEFNRIINGSRAGLTLIPKAIATRDSELLRRILIELRAFDRQLTSRFG